MTKKEYKKVSVRHSAEMAVMFQHGKVKGKRLLQMFPQYSRTSIYRHATKPISAEEPVDKRKFNKGRPRKLTANDERHIFMAINKLRSTDGSFTSPRIAETANLLDKVSMWTVRRTLNRSKYYYLQSRRKGILTVDDLKLRTQFCQKVKQMKLGPQFWREGISLYLDGKGFAYKTNPLSQARAPSAREWRKRGEGLDFGCTAKGRKEGVTNCNFMVAISYNKGVVMCQQYEGTITGAKMADIALNNMPQALELSINPKGKRILMDGCPRQNSKTALKAISDIGGKIFSIPSRSPDLNPIENVFNIAVKMLRKQALTQKITHESFEKFAERVQNTMFSIPSEAIDNIIDSMQNRINLIIKTKGNRCRY